VGVFNVKLDFTRLVAHHNAYQLLAHSVQPHLLEQQAKVVNVLNV
jgi:hypothetical protein